MTLLFFIIPVWICVLILITTYFIFRKILPTYKITISEVSFQELLLALNAAIQTEFELWEKDVFVDKGSITNSNFENYYLEITDHIIKSLSPIFFTNISKYITEDAVVSIIGRKTKEYLSGKVNGTV